MCGIMAYMGREEATPILLDGIKKLEYRGYDSSGIATLNGKLQIIKQQGNISQLEHALAVNTPKGTIGIAHTRWATHGVPNKTNAHPHISPSGELTLVHNGIIENFMDIKQDLQSKGFNFRTDTDSEVIAYLIEYHQQEENLSLIEASRKAIKELDGSYAIVILHHSEPNLLIAARKGSPLVAGRCKNEFFVSSDPMPLMGKADEVYYAHDEDLIVIDRNEGMKVSNLKGEAKKTHFKPLANNVAAMEKHGYDHFMLKEILEQSETLKACINGRITAGSTSVSLPELDGLKDKLANANRLIITACGTSWHSGLTGEYFIENLSELPVEVEYASEFRYRNPLIFPTDIVIAISQSGETADTLAAIEIAKEKGATTLGICNVDGSTIFRETDACILTKAGPEIGVASTKAFTTQLAVLLQLSLYLKKLRNVENDIDSNKLINDFIQLPDKMSQLFQHSKKLKKIAAYFTYSRNFLFLGRGFNFPIALEGALKLKEISYIHAEGYPAAEMKHGPIALIDFEMPSVIIATEKHNYRKIVSNAKEIKARNGRLISVVMKGDKELASISDFIIEIPETHDTLTPFLSVIPLQLLAYHIALVRGCNVDQPRNLAKAVTVE